MNVANHKLRFNKMETSVKIMDMDARIKTIKTLKDVMIARDLNKALKSINSITAHQ